MFKKNSHFHFMGIGGIGMSAIAKILKNQGYIVSGCDVDSENRTVKELQKLGCEISFEHNGSACQNKSINFLIYSTAVQKNNPEINSAQKNGTIIIHRATVLAELMKQKFSIAVAGSHGKTTTSAMISHVLIESELDPTIIIGGHLKNISDNSRYGKSDFLVAETDESDKSIEILYPTYGVITNIDLEHLETYKNIEEIKKTFSIFINKLPFYGKVIVCLDDPEIRTVLPLNIETITYGIDNISNIMAKNVELLPDYSTYDAFQNNQYLGKVHLNMPGKHNVLNSLATLAVCLDLDINFEPISKALKTFQGIERRFSFNGKFNGAEVFDDYGHHPNEIINILKVARKKTKKKLHVVFQPHRFTRTEKLWNQFVDTFVNYPVDNLIITDIYPAFESPIENINSLNLVNDIKRKNPNLNVTYIPLDNEFKAITNELELNVKNDDILLLQGAGRVNKIAQKLIIK